MGTYIDYIAWFVEWYVFRPAKENRSLIQMHYKLSNNCLPELFSPSKYTDNLLLLHFSFLSQPCKVQIYQVVLRLQKACISNRSWNFELIQWPQQQGFSGKTLIIILSVSWKTQEFQQTFVCLQVAAYMYVCIYPVYKKTQKNDTFEYSNKRNMLNHFKSNLNFNLVLGFF